MAGGYRMLNMATLALLFKQSCIDYFATVL
jgi:hypothetical protein